MPPAIPSTVLRRPSRLSPWRAGRNIPQPRYLQRWCDLAAVAAKHTGKKGNLRASVEAAGLAWEGRAHSAIDDARNTARCVGWLGAGGRAAESGACLVRLPPCCCRCAGANQRAPSSPCLLLSMPPSRLAVKLMAGGIILGVTGSFTGVDASGKFKQATLQLGRPAGSGGGKPSGGGGGAGVSLGYGFRAHQKNTSRKKA